MLIKELFERNPTRALEPIVKVDQHDPAVLRTELDEYIVTDEILEHLSDIIDRFIESRVGVPPTVCAWISGFFGSGKSHFLKIIGYILSNRTIELESGQEIGAATYFCEKHGLPGAKTLERELKTRAIFVNMLDRDVASQSSISRIVHYGLSRELGFSEVPWVAEVERMMQAEGLWNGFLDFVEKERDKPWPEVRRMQVRARSLLARGLQKLDPMAYPTVDLAEKSLEDVRGGLELTPSRIAQRLLEEAEALDANGGRVVVLLDEVGLYVATNTDRLTELNALSEQIAKVGKGKVWLFVTAQEALEEVIPKVEARAGEFQWIRDRFRIKISLTPENIDVVVKRRWLQKIADREKLELLNKLYDSHSGTLATAATIKNPHRDYRGLFTELTHGQFIASYPLMPYYVRLMQEIFSILRSRGGAAQDISGRERAVLLVTRSLFIGSDKKPGLAGLPLGELATFDRVYDAIDEELKVVRSEQQAMIGDEIANLGERDGLRVDSVAKALFLLQQVSDWLPCTVENIAAVLYPRLGAEKNRIERSVRECLSVLREGMWVAEEEGKYRFLSAVERTFEQEVNRQTANEDEKRELTQEILKRHLKEFKSYNYRNLRTFNVYLVADEVELASKGHLKLNVYSPIWSRRDPKLMESLVALSLANRDALYWIAKKDERLESQLERIICTEKALKEYEPKVKSEDERRSLDRQRGDIEILCEDELPRLLDNALSTGTIIYQGEETVLDGRKALKEVFNTQMKELAEELFTEFHHAAFRVEKDEHIGTILSWDGGILPGIYRELQLIDDQGQILIDRPVAARVLAEVNRRNSENLDTSGGILADHFEAPPYGWDPRVVRLTLATLFRNGSITVNLDGKEYISVTETGSHDAFTKTHPFNRARFASGVEVTPEQRNEASRLVSEIFGVRGGQTIEEIDSALCKAIDARLDNCGRLLIVTKTIHLPIVEGLSALEKTMSEIAGAGARSRRILAFLGEDRIEVLKARIPVLAKLLDFESKGKLDNYRKIRRFAYGIAPDLASLIGDKALEKSIDSLKQSLSAEDFLDRWPTIIELFQKLCGKYDSTYTKEHSKREELVKNALGALRLHPVLKDFEKEKTCTLLGPLESIHCTEKVSQASEAGFVCETCHTSLRELSYQSELAEIKRREVRGKLDEIAQKVGKKPEEYPTALTIDKKISSVKEITEVTTKMTEAANRAFKKGKSVKVSVDLEVLDE
ncbi:hypothetical protein HKBW3S42_00382 [Candidatus Hakubella thermalkaliphila]|uniref:Probable ATP-binding protein BrxC winged helix-turn-helix domain-containing protein n=1 Tax=Candidatus Hakubella thermalkaliphila TaxID=2754717 RepID=A0A6V8QFA1_9ACTN|nr:hypothetical protein HKBW3S42_00382 [Candidatus Hakubella thermalkaliphila]GFP42704.1 hypothetical protein HKBW3C_01828 [Candidatus Hakubella thermalkaliphila]